MSRYSYHRGSDGSVDRVDKTSNDGKKTESYKPDGVGQFFHNDPCGKKIGEQRNDTSKGKSDYRKK